MGRGNKHIQLVMVLYCKLSTIGKLLPSFPNRVGGLIRRGRRQVCYHKSHRPIATVYQYNIGMISG